MRVPRSLYLRMTFACVFGFYLSTTSVAQSAQLRLRVTQPVDVENLVELRGNTHPLARPENDRGAAPDSLPLDRILLVLQRTPEQEAALRRLLDQQQMKSSPNYHQWLTPEEYGKQFGPADTDIQAVTDWLTSQGFQVNRVGAGRTVIEFSGTAGLARQALHTEMHKYEVNGEEHWANASDPQIPSALQPVVAGFASLNNFPRKPMHHLLGTFSRSKVTGEVRPLFNFTDSAGTFFAVGPTDFATIYNVLPLWLAGTDGTGQKIAIVADSNINIQDVRDFRSMFGLPVNDPAIILDGPDPGITADEVEADLDVQWAGAVAKNATIDLVVSQNTETSFGVDLSALYVIDNNIAPVMSTSFGACESALGTSGNAFYGSLWEQAAAQGITVVAASGDSGSAECDNPNTENAAILGLAADGTSSTPFNVAVGGTDFNDRGNTLTYWNSTNGTGQASARSYIPETTWNDSCAQAGLSGCTTVKTGGADLAGGGGGPSAVYIKKPSWQTGAGVPNDGVRDSPDVALFSGDGSISGSFYVFCQRDANSGTGSSTSSCDLNSPFQNFQGAGGTSFATPSFVGIMAMVNQKTGQRQGNANYVLYPLAAQSGASCASNTSAVGNSACIFYDVITGNNSVACVGGKPNCSNTNTAANQFGVLVNPNSPSSPAWTTTPGYDLATGLGSMNALNLVNNWTLVSFKGTSTTLALSTTPATNPIMLTHGQAVNLTVNVTSGSGTPTGDASLLGGPASQLGIGAFTLTNGAFSGTSIFLPGGSYGVSAHYAGDGTFGASDSTPPVQVTVNPEPSKTSFAMVTFDASGNVTSTNATTAPYGSPYIVRVEVYNNSGLACYAASESIVYPCPTGQVALTSNGLPLPNQGSGSPSAYTLNSSGHLEDLFIQFPVGLNNVVANYAGDISYAASTTTDAITITQAATSTTVTALPTTVAPGANVALTAVVSTNSSGMAPTGTVQFLNGGVPISGAVTLTGTAGTLTASASLQAALTTTFTTTANITAQYSGDSNYAASTSAATTVTVQADFSLSANPASANISAPGQSGTSTITLAALNGFTGSVNFTCAVPATMNEAACSMTPASLTTSGTTTLTVTTTAPSAAPPMAAPLNGPGWFVAALGTLLVVVFVMIPAKHRRPKLALGMLALVLLAEGFVACGGGSSGGGGGGNPGTAVGTYTITVTATSGALTHTANVSIVVQ